MKILTSTTAALLLATLAPSILAEEPAATKCEMCEMMKKMAAAKTPAAKPSGDLAAQTAELDKLVTEMNGSLGSKKIEAMAAVVTRLVEQYKALGAANPTAPAEAPKEEPHHH